MASAVGEKTEEELRKELFELNRQQHEVFSLFLSVYSISFCLLDF